MKNLYEFIKERTWSITEQWYADLDKSKDGVYGTTDYVQIQSLKNQNHEFHVIFCELFNADSSETEERFDNWLDAVARDQGHLNTPLDQIIGEFLTVQEQYYRLVQDYVISLDYTSTHDEVYQWNNLITASFSKLIREFSKRNIDESEKLLQAQQEMIVELSSPVIKIKQDVAILPLVGDIDTHRAQVIFDKTLSHCNEFQIEELVIDLSGVVIIDTMVAAQIFQVIDGLKLIGTVASLTGIRPEIAQTAVQLGINFSGVKVYATLEQALQNTK
ncbi:STAS domain-containing protein [Cytobacillus purgationiresistens]|uniref:RsbT co-antagonist protein RsbR n=1 Tax=Cytobacillus purgationiresistens TaxID=863449 RepID=A0ABU0AQ82_9BACI|nr:STAS domain-containing protein [Cytobacillus purgationiresistens]MDQ0273446.1 rsbT co-antagonist protein RsbR [Cytobacillus purgationiresistens]